MAGLLGRCQIQVMYLKLQHTWALSPAEVFSCIKHRLFGCQSTVLHAHAWTSTDVPR